VHLHIIGQLEAPYDSRLQQRFPALRVTGGTDLPDDPPDAMLNWRGGDIAVVERAVERVPELKWLHITRAGVPLSLAALLEGRPTQLTNASGVHAPGIAEYVLGVTLAHLQRHQDLQALNRSRDWDKRFTFRELGGATVGILGPGAIGLAAARLFKAFGARVVGLRRRPEPLPDLDRTYTPADLAEFLPDLDVLVIAAPLTRETQSLLGAAELARLKRGAYLVNIARGAIVDETALLEALRSGQVGGAALDVFEDEPLPPASPFWSAPNVLVTPHMSGKTDRVNDRRFSLFADNLARFVAGEPLRNVVDVKLGY
jgi:phosphoglycerate dehydrogenase-like enzyme